MFTSFQIRTRASLILAIMEQRVFKKEIISNVHVGEDTQANNVKVRIIYFWIDFVIFLHAIVNIFPIIQL